jgi:large subunit ribosomal protein L10
VPKPQKVEAVRKLKDRLKSSDAALLAEFTGLKVGEMLQLRRKLAENGTKFSVVKNTLSRIAAQEANIEELVPFLTGSTAIAFIKGDAVVAARGIDEIAKKYPALVIKGGVLNGRVLNADQAQALSRIESREVLLGQLASLVSAPLQKMAYVIQAPLGALGNALSAYLKKLEEQSGPVAPGALAPQAAEGTLAPETVGT